MRKAGVGRRVAVPTVIVCLAAVAAGRAGALPQGARAAATGAAPLCTTAAVSGSNVDTDCTPGNTFETPVAVDPVDPAHLLGAAITITFAPSGSGLKLTLDVSARVSLDTGRTWSTYAIGSNGYSGSIDPSVAFDPSGTAYIATADSGRSTNGDIVVASSADGGQTWGAPVRVAQGTGAGGTGVSNDHPQLAATGTGSLVVTWIHSVFDSHGVLVDAPMQDAVSHDGGRTWSTPADISGSAPFCTGAAAPNACDLTFGNAVAVSSAAILVTYQVTSQDAPNGGTSLARNQHVAVTVDPATGALTGGPFLIGQAYDGIEEADFPVSVEGLQTLHDSQLNLDLDGNVAADPSDPTGRHFAAVWYDDRSAPHPVDANPYRAVTNSDIVVSQSYDAGRTWSAPVTIAEPNDQFMPSAVYDPSGRLLVGYLDRAYDPANLRYGYTLATEQPRGSLRFSLQQVTTALSDPTRNTATGPPQTIDPAFPNPALGIGDYTGIAVTPTSVVSTWTDLRNTGCVLGTCGSVEDDYSAVTPLR